MYFVVFLFRIAHSDLQLIFMDVRLAGFVIKQCLIYPRLKIQSVMWSIGFTSENSKK